MTQKKKVERAHQFVQKQNWHTTIHHCHQSCKYTNKYLHCSAVFNRFSLLPFSKKMKILVSLKFMWNGGRKKSMTPQLEETQRRGILEKKLTL